MTGDAPKAIPRARICALIEACGINPDRLIWMRIEYHAVIAEVYPEPDEAYTFVNNEIPRRFVHIPITEDDL